MSDKTEKATAYKLQKAKEKGQVSKSNELSTTVLLSAMFLVGYALWPSLLNQLKALMAYLLVFAAHIPLQVNQTSRLHHVLLLTLITWWLPFALLSLSGVIITTITQTGFIWSIKPLLPNSNRLSIVQGIKRLFSTKTLFEMTKACLKLSGIFFLILLILPAQISAILQLLSHPAPSHPQLIAPIILKFSIQLLLLLLGFALLDKLYVNWKFKKDLRMSKQEVKEEYRQREGDPKIRFKIKQLQQQLRQKTTSLNQIKTADVLITNPTQLAIALKYDHSSMPAPKVVFKAQGDFAHQARTLAQRYQIPIIQNKLFAQSLFATVEVNHSISYEHYPIAATIFRELYQHRGRA